MKGLLSGIAHLCWRLRIGECGLQIEEGTQPPAFLCKAPRTPAGCEVMESGNGNSNLSHFRSAWMFVPPGLFFRGSYSVSPGLEDSDRYACSRQTLSSRDKLPNVGVPALKPNDASTLRANKDD